MLLNCLYFVVCYWIVYYWIVYCVDSLLMLSGFTITTRGTQWITGDKLLINLVYTYLLFSLGEDYDFDKVPESENMLLNKFDYNSIMMYSNYAFSKNKEKTIVAKNGQVLLKPIWKTALDDSDIERVNLLYKCNHAKNTFQKRKRLLNLV